MRTSTPITVIGGGLAGLVASITIAEASAEVDLHEAHAMLGGRGRSTQPPFVANLGPHVIYNDGPLWAWLRERGLPAAYRRPPVTGLRFRSGGTVHRRPPLGLTHVFPLLARHRSAPVDVSLRAWLSTLAGPSAVEAIVNFAGVATFTADPGEWSAAFVWERLRRSLRVPPAARYAVGGWTSMIDGLARLATDAGVRIHTGSPVSEVPASGPVIVATELGAARRLLRDESLVWTGGRAVLLDVGLVARRGDPFVISDLDEAGWVERFSAADPTLSPRGHSLVQGQLGLAVGESLEEGVTRLEAILDAGFAGWRDREVWRRRSVVDGRSGALDPPGTTWRDRPAVDRGDGVFLCGDMVAAPGLLGEVSWASARRAADLALAHVHRVGASPHIVRS